MEIRRVSSFSSGCATFWPMSLRWCGTVIDCHDARAQSRWWAEVLGWQIAAEDDDGIVTVLPPAERGPGLLFQPVPEGHERQNRAYLVVAPPDGGDKETE